MQPNEIREIRSEFGWTQADLADIIGMSRKAISEMESGAAPIEQRTKLAILYTRDQARAVAQQHRPVLNVNDPLLTAVRALAGAFIAEDFALAERVFASARMNVLRHPDNPAAFEALRFIAQGEPHYNASLDIQR